MNVNMFTEVNWNSESFNQVLPSWPGLKDTWLGFTLKILYLITDRQINLKGMIFDLFISYNYAYNDKDEIYKLNIPILIKRLHTALNGTS